MRDWLFEVAEQAVPYVHQAALADGSQGLELSHMFWPLLPLHAPHADANGARRDDDDSVAIFPEPVGSLDYEGQVGEEWLVSLLIYNGTSPCMCVTVSQPCFVLLYNFKTQPGVLGPGMGRFSPSLMTIPRDFGPFMSATVDQPVCPRNEPEMTSKPPWKREKPDGGGGGGDLVPSSSIFSTRQNSHCDSSPGSMV